MPRILCLLLFLCSAAFAQEGNFRDDALTLTKLVAEHHFAPRTIDDKFSEETFDAFIAILDPDKLFFTAQEINQLSNHRRLLDDELQGKQWQFLSAITPVYKQALERSIRIIEALSATRQVFAPSDRLTQYVDWAGNDQDLKSRWSSELKYSLLSRLVEYHQVAEDRKRFDEKEPEARRRTQRRAVRSIKRILDHSSGFGNYVGEVYLQVVASSFDPHTAYLSSTAIENFIASLSTEGYFFGFLLNENERGEIVIENLNPGGPAWRSGLLNKGDVIRELWWEGQQPIDLEDALLADVETILLEDNHATLHLRVMKPGGSMRIVSLMKEKITNDQNIVKSFILQADSRIGYVSLPGFYTDWGEADVARCANDVATEIIKLKREGIEGLIFDLRFNGGGSLFEAVSMAGIFIDAGAVGILKSRSDEKVVKDMNRGTVYDGPLVVMVNGSSASASELLAATLQDYRRAIIVGSPTFGKATAQNLFPLKRGTSSNTSFTFYPETSYASITLEKIYRVTGKTAQLNGVQPDIVLPDVYDSLNFREASIPGALSSDSTTKKSYYRPLELLPIEYLKARSEQRVATSAGFSSITRASRALAHATREHEISLNPSIFFNATTEWRSALEGLEKNSSGTGSFSITNHAFEEQHMQVDESLTYVNEAWKEKLLRDVQLEEAFFIMSDYINLDKQK